MREMKFRCWDNTSNRMYRVAGIDYRFDLITIVNPELNRDFRDVNYIDFHFHDLDFKDRELMQYTGLKDKNGKEIYEGDIVKVRYKGKEDIGKIIYEYNGFTIDVMNMKRPYGRVPLIERFTEVIGNIYENPELLEVQ